MRDPVKSRFVPSLAALILVGVGCQSEAPQRPVDGQGGAGGTSSGMPSTGGGSAGGGEPLPFACPSEADEVFESLVAQFEKRLIVNGVPGGAVAMVCGGGIDHVAGVGEAWAGGPDVTPDTRFQWASTTKMFTAAAAMVLVEDGLVSLTQPVSEVVPALAYPELTLHHLLSHTGAYPTQWATFVSTELGPTVEANGQIDLWEEPGTLHVYSNPGFSVAGYVLEVAAGQPFATLVEERVFAPAGLQATFDVNVVLAGDHAVGHAGTGEVQPDGSYLHHGVYGPMGGAWGSVRDLARWAQIHAHPDGAFSPTALAALRTPQTMTGIPATSYGYGLFIRNSVPVVVHHSGSAVGYRADWRAVPELGLGIAMVVNADWYMPTDLAVDALDQLAEPTFSSFPTFGTFDDYVGSYLDPYELGAIEVSIDQGKLMVAFVDDGLTLEATHGYGDVYLVAMPDNSTRDLHFWRPNDMGAATHIASRFGIAPRIP